MITLTDLKHIMPEQHVLQGGDGHLWTVLKDIKPPLYGEATLLVEDPSGTETHIHFTSDLGFIDFQLDIIPELNQDSAAVKNIGEISATLR